MFGVDDPEFGQAVKAVVVPRPGSHARRRRRCARSPRRRSRTTRCRRNGRSAPSRCRATRRASSRRSRCAPARRRTSWRSSAVPLDLARARRAGAHRARAAGGAERRGRLAVGAARARGGRGRRRPDRQLRAARARGARRRRARCSTAPPRRATTARARNRNARLFLGVAQSPVKLSPGSDAVQVPDEIGVEPGDIVLPRHHGLGPMTGTQLDPMLRNLGVTHDRRRRRLGEHRHDEPRVRRGQPGLPDRAAVATRSPACRPSTRPR